MTEDDPNFVKSLKIVAVEGNSLKLVVIAAVLLYVTSNVPAAVTALVRIAAFARLSINPPSNMVKMPE